MESKNRFEDFFKEAEARRGELAWSQKLGMLISFLVSCKAHGIPMEEYFKYEFYLKNNRGKQAFAILPKRKKFYYQFNDLEERKWFDDKSLFPDKFKNFLGRDIINMSKTSADEFIAFLNDHQKIFLKPADGSYGIGTEVIESGGVVDPMVLYESLCGKPIIVEEYINQDTEMEMFNEGCVNSIRIMTFLKNNSEVDIIPYSALRLGRKGKVADNFHHDGITAMVDSDSGCVMTIGLDKNGNRWIKHPDSGKTIIGFQIPHWDKVCDCVKRAALVCPKVRFVGWDVAVTDNEEAILIEGNSHPDPDVIQVVDGIGKWYIFQKYIDEENISKNG